MKRIVEPHETDAEVLKILQGCLKKGAVVWATHASGHIEPATKNDFVVTPGKKKRGKGQDLTTTVVRVIWACCATLEFKQGTSKEPPCTY